MPSLYPGQIDTFTDPAGTSPLATGPDHAADHTTLHSAIGTIEYTLGTNSGTAVLKNFTAGKFAARTVGETHGTSTWIGGTIGTTLIGTSTIQGGTLTSNVINGTPVIGTPSISGGSAASLTLGTPTITLSSDATGDLFYRSAGGTVTRLGIGTNTQYLTTNGTTPNWATLATEVNDGWIAASGTWSFSSGSVITINTDLSTSLAKGDKLRFVQGGTTEYFYLVGFGLASGTTTGTLAGDSGTPVANAAISSPYTSKKTSPFAFPGWFAWSPTLAGFSPNPTFVSRYSINGNTCSIMMDNTNTGTSNAVTKTFTLPVVPLRSIAAITGGGKDNGGLLAAPIQVSLSAGNATVSVYKSFYQVAWTGSGDCNYQVTPFSYEY
jgi:hypothetical protein